MAQTMTPKITVSVTGQRTNTGDLETGTVTLAKQIANAFTTGAGANQCNLMWTDTRTLAGDAADSLDLAGSLTDTVFGGTAVFARIKAIIIYSKNTANKDLVIGGGSNALAALFAAAGDAIKLQAGGVFVITNPTAGGYAVTGGTGDILTITNGSGGSSTYDIIILGAST